MSTFMIWYRTAAGKLSTVKIQAKSKTEAVKKFKKTVRNTPPMRVLKLKLKSAMSGKKSRRKKTRKTKRSKARLSGTRCLKKPEETESLFGRKKRRSKRKTRKSSSMSGKNKNRNLVLIPHGDKAKAEAMKDKLKNNIIIYGSKKRKLKGGAKMRREKEIMNMLISGLTGAGSAVAGSLAINYIPLPENLKPFLPLALGIALPMIPGKGKAIKEAASIGLITIGTIILLKKYMPQLPLGMAGEITETDLSLLGMNEDVDSENVDELTGELTTMGAGDFITTADA